MRVHTDTYATQLSQQLNAQAFTVGSDIYFNRGRFLPDSKSGMHLLAHELAHVVQQDGGAQRTIQRTVEEVVINCADNQVHFQHDGRTTSYHLDHCDVSDGTYNAGVRLGTNRVDFDLDTTTPGTHFDFRYSIGPGQANPNTFFTGQSSVRIVCTHTPGAAPNGGSFRFSVRNISAEEYRQMTGGSPDTLPEGVMVPLSSVAGPVAPQPHVSSFDSRPRRCGRERFLPHALVLPAPQCNRSGVDARPPLRMVQPALRALPHDSRVPRQPGLLHGGDVAGDGEEFHDQLHEGVPGSFANDALFPLMPGEQSYLYVLRSEAEATAFAARLRQTEYGGRYTYSPPRSQPDPILGEVRSSEAQMYEILVNRGRAPMCTNNCITVPGAEVDAAIGMRPTTPSGVDVMAGTGPGGVTNPTMRGELD